MSTRVRHAGVWIGEFIKRSGARAFGYIRCIERERTRKEVEAVL